MLTPLQERLAALVAGLPEARGFALAGGAGLAAHGLLQRATRDLDYFGPPQAGPEVALLARAIDRACSTRGLTVRQERQTETFARLSISDGSDSCEIDVAIDYRAVEPVQTRFGPAMDLRELGANKVLAVFDRGLARDFVDLAELNKRFTLVELVVLARHKDTGLDLAVLDHAMGHVERLPPEQFGLDEAGFTALHATVQRWRDELRDLRELWARAEEEGPEHGIRVDPL